MVRKLLINLALAAGLAVPAYAESGLTSERRAFDAAVFDAIIAEATVEPGATRLRIPEIRSSSSQPTHHAFRTTRYGPFRVTDDGRALLVGATDISTPEQFEEMIRDHPGVRQLDFIEAPGTLDDRANLRLGRMIREAGLTTHVPAEGSVRSGAVELFLAGTRRSMDDGAEFAVHSWQDKAGNEANDFGDDAAEHRRYLDYYRAMGFDDVQARSFYAFTNSVAHADALWLDARQMRGLLPPDARTWTTPRSIDARAIAAPALLQLATGSHETKMHRSVQLALLDRGAMERAPFASRSAGSRDNLLDWQRRFG